MHCWAISCFLHEVTQTTVKEKWKVGLGFGTQNVHMHLSNGWPKGKTEVCKKPTVKGLWTLGVSYFWPVCLWCVTLTKKPLMVHVWPNVHGVLNLSLEYRKWWISVGELSWSETGCRLPSPHPQHLRESPALPLSSQPDPDPSPYFIPSSSTTAFVPPSPMTPVLCGRPEEKEQDQVWKVDHGH